MSFAESKFSEIFEKVPHERLQAKVKSHGGGVCWWLENWLVGDQKQRVVING